MTGTGSTPVPSNIFWLSRVLSCSLKNMRTVSLRQGGRACVSHVCAFVCVRARVCASVRLSVRVHVRARVCVAHTAARATRTTHAAQATCRMHCHVTHRHRAPARQRMRARAARARAQPNLFRKKSAIEKFPRFSLMIVCALSSICAHTHTRAHMRAGEH